MLCAMGSLRFLLFIPALAILGMAGGCGRTETRVEQGNREGVLVRGNGTEPESLDPHLVRGGPEWTVIAALFEPLVTPDPQTSLPVPAAAARWNVDPNGLVYTFHLRDDAVWSDGVPVTAHDFLWSVQRLASPGIGSAHAEDTLFFLRGARGYQAGKLPFSDVGARVDNDRTLVLTLEKPTPFFLSALYQFYPVPRHVVEQHGTMTDRKGAWTKPGVLVGNGPFILQRWAPQQVIEVVKNRRYWDAAQVRLNGIHFLPFENPSTEESAFRSGQLHLTNSLPLQKIAVYQRDRPDVLKIVSDLGNAFYSVNVNKPPLTDVRVRQALAWAIDREALVKRVILGGKQPGLAFTPSGLDGYTPAPGVGFDPARAKALLAEAGFPEGRGFPTIELLVDTRDHHRVVAEAIQQMWEKNLGVRLAIRNEETRVLLASKRAMQFDLVRGSWNATTYLDPWYFLGPWTTGGLFNEAKWSNADYDALMRRIEATAEPAMRRQLFAEAEAIFLRELPAIPLYFGTQVMLMHPSVKGWSGRPFGDRLFKTLWVE